jgi:hypothetical protein
VPLSRRAAQATFGVRVQHRHALDHSAPRLPGPGTNWQRYWLSLASRTRLPGYRLMQSTGFARHYLVLPFEMLSTALRKVAVCLSPSVPPSVPTGQKPGSDRNRRMPSGTCGGVAPVAG